MRVTKAMAAAALMLAAGSVNAGDSAPMTLDLRTGDRASAGAETLACSSLWDGGEGATATIAQDGAAIAANLSGEGERAWSAPFAKGEYAQGSQWVRVFSQDFGGNGVSDPEKPQTTTLSVDETVSTLRFSGNAAMSGVYYLTKQSTENSDWHKGSDHTYPNDVTRGYYMRVNPNGSQSNDVMYVHRLSGIGQGATFKFSAFLSNLQISETGSKPHLGIGIYEDKEGTTLVSPNAFKDITLNKITDATSTVLPWQELSLEFQMDHSSGTAYFVVCAIQPETNGFDFAIDDISIDVLHPTVNIVNLDEYLFGQTVRLAADFENDGYFSNMNNVIYKWYYSADGSDYQEIYASSYTASKSFVLPIQYFDKDKDNGYYRVKIGESGSFESDICSIQGDFRVNETRNKKLVCLRHGEYNAEYNISADDPDIYDGMEIDINSSLTIIIRIIKPRTQTVTFDENGGTCAVETNAYAIGEQYGWLPEAAWQGHMFLGWWAADPEGAGEVPVATTNIVTEESARTLWARWAVLPFVSNVVARQRWPWNGLVDVDYEISGYTAGLKAEIVFEEQGGTNRWTATKFFADVEPTLNPGLNRATWDSKAEGATDLVATVVATMRLVREE